MKHFEKVEINDMNSTELLWYVLVNKLLKVY